VGGKGCRRLIAVFSPALAVIGASARAGSDGLELVGRWDDHGATTSNGLESNIAVDDNVTGHYLSSDTSGFYRNYFLTDSRIYGLSVRASF
jgi:hypothetical protein